MPSREQWIERLFEEEENKSSLVAKACKKFLDAQRDYRNGKGDVIAGLRRLDELEREIIQLVQ